MSLRKNRQIFNILVTLPVAGIVLAACVLSGLAVRENMRFVRITGQISDFVNSVRGAASQQISFAQNAGEDLWDDLVRVGRVDAKASHLNMWGGAIRATTVSTAAGPVAMRLENDVPTVDCRRLALYFVNRMPTDLGIASIEAQTVGDDKWILVYPLSVPVYEKAALFACGKSDYARLAVTFKIR